MRFILGLPTDEVERHEEFGTTEAVAEMARAAESLGYEGVFVTDHPIPPEKFLQRGGHHALEPTVVLAVAATATTRLRLMTNLYIVGYRNPFLAAKAIASLDSLSGGRVILGTGAGYLEPEFRALGTSFDTRNERLDESLDVMKRVWSGETIDVTGEGFEAHGHVALPRPARRPHPPVWIGGNTRRALRRAVEHGDGWIPMPAPKAFARFVRSAPLESLDDLQARLEYARSHAAQVGRTAPLDVMFGPIGVGSYGAPGFEASAYVEQAGRLREIGVTYAGVSFALPGSGAVQSRARFLDLAAGFMHDVASQL
ncbi:MAG: TIGR03619 family F420-dependent LLM class oxidoreductase [Deltaproteobacteria bacterium]|nr:TIGR03619 family F420-dependent LLM class oxidoreductase [Deltaproteobacteria bacterium]